MDRIAELHAAGQSLWYDNIQRKLLENGELETMIRAGQIRGVTSNPTIFNNAISKSNDYDTALKPLAMAGMSAEDIFWHLAIEDIQAAADLFRPLYNLTKGGDGYVSLEVSPYLANDTEKTIQEARRLWERVNRPNLMIKIPATQEGLPAIRKSIAGGINVNVTLIFSLERYAAVMDAYMAGLEDRIRAGHSVSQIASVASFFVSRVDTKVDAKLQKMAPPHVSLQGKAAVANAKLAYQTFLQTTAGERFSALQKHGARLQRPLWASTGTKNPAYSDVIYVEELIGPNTVNTVPPQTLAAFADHGRTRLSLIENIEDAQSTIEELEKIGIRMSDVTTELEVEGVKAFADSFTELLASVEARRITSLG